MKLTVSIIKQYQKRKKELKTIGQFKKLGRELRDKFKLTDSEAIDILNKRSDKILDILQRKEKE